MTMINLLADIQAKMAEGKSTGYERWPKKYNRKEKALPHKDINRIPFMSKARGHQKIW